MHEDKTILSLFRGESHIDFCTKCVIVKFTPSLMTFEIQQRSCIVIYVLYLSIEKDYLSIKKVAKN